MYKSLRTKKKLLFSLFFVSLLLCFFVMVSSYIYRLGVDHGRKMEIHLSSPWRALQNVMLISKTLEGEEPDCITELFSLNAEIVMYKDTIPGWEKLFFSDEAKKQELRNKKILEELKDYRKLYPLTEAYYEACKNKDSEYFEIYKKRTEEAWDYIMSK